MVGVMQAQLFLKNNWHVILLACRLLAQLL